MKECQKCFEFKEESEFYITSSYQDKGYADSICKKCRQHLRKYGEPTKEEKIKKWCKELEKVWNMGKWLKERKGNK